MAINVGAAINPYTAVEVTYREWREGEYTQENGYREWVEGVYAPAVQTLAVKTSVGHADSEGIYGKVLDPRKEGERLTEHAKFTMKESIPVRSIIEYRDTVYKVVRVAEYQGYGYSTYIARSGVDG